MCGIAGIITPNAKEYEGHVKRMVDALRHRGPDEMRVNVYDGAVLGHARLSIVDLLTGQQPMSIDKQVAITFNGEIYGYQAIREKLGFSFKTTSDTEVLLALYKKYQQEMLHHVPGMFAFGLWDIKRKQLFAARDRFGEKPFFYCRGPKGEFIFASEIKAILASGLVEPIVDKQALGFYLKHLYVNPRTTIYSNIYTLPPAHRLIYNEGKVRVEKYWTMPVTNESITLDQAIEQFEFLMIQAIKKQLVADVPIGAFLSGGLDSSTIVALASAYKSGLKTFSFGFKDGVNELSFAKVVAEKYHTEHFALEDSYDVASLLPKMSEVYDEPFADSSNIPTYIVSEFARQHVPVVLTGDGGDELVGGYGWYKAFLYGNSIPANVVTTLFFKNLARVFHVVGIGSVSQKLYKLNSRLEHQHESNSILEAHDKQYSWFSDQEVFKMGVDNQTTVFEQMNRKTDLMTVDDLMRLDLENYMPGDILVKIDRASMAHGLELRAPFLDIDVASFLISLPSRLKVTKADDKIILRKAFQKYWPDLIRKRRKHGFGAPVEEWLRRANMQKLKKEVLMNKAHSMYKVLKYEEVTPFVEKDNYQTWTLLVLALWFDQYNPKV